MVNVGALFRAAAVGALPALAFTAPPEMVTLPPYTLMP